MTLTASPTRPPSTAAAARMVDVTKVYGSGDTAVRARRPLEVRRLPFTVPWILAATTPAERTHFLGSAPLALKLIRYAGGGRHARLSARALGLATRGVG